MRLANLRYQCPVSTSTPIPTLLASLNPTMVRKWMYGELASWLPDAIWTFPLNCKSSGSRCRAPLLPLLKRHSMQSKTIIPLIIRNWYSMGHSVLSDWSYALEISVSLVYPMCILQWKQIGTCWSFNHRWVIYRVVLKRLSMQSKAIIPLAISINIPWIILCPLQFVLKSVYC